MKSATAALALVASIAAGGACASPNSSAASAGILDAEASELAAWEAQDIDAIMNAYARDAIVMPGGSTIASREDLRKLFVAFLEDPGFSLTFRSDPPLVAESGEIGVTVGTYAVSFTDPESRQVIRKTGRHLMTWRRESDGQWRVFRQMTAHDR